MQSEEKMTFSEKMENYWYHYKWQTIIGVFFMVVIAVCTVQCAGNGEPDVMLMYAGNYAVPDEYRERSLESLMSEDYNGDGEKRADVFQLVLNIVERGGEYEYYDAVGQNEELNRLEIEFYTGQSVIYILHPYIYGQYKNVMLPLEKIGANISEEAKFDECAVKISELPAYSETILGFFPPECVLCIRNIRSENTLISKADDEEYYADNLDFFRVLTEFSEE